MSSNGRFRSGYKVTLTGYGDARMIQKLKLSIFGFALPRSGEVTP
jgi:hypothetical protein